MLIINSVHIISGQSWTYLHSSSTVFYISTSLLTGQNPGGVELFLALNKFKKPMYMVESKGYGAY